MLAVTGLAIGVSDENDIGQSEASALEARLTASTGLMRFIFVLSSLAS